MGKRESLRPVRLCNGPAHRKEEAWQDLQM
uniref:Uncharacterized protein n=2 Tax=unclassified Ackermannviridae TaxID=2175602 RepID=A0A8S5VX68_9CAUD|nr:MAG TPA: hypothetical protein [Ackermannviridae sp. ctQad106]DAI05924.1 MAG TPA: hypothetical protein [Ackermannviridae sp.]DAP62646.1 MAG TPA: hypothetical protein [Ackermannviridae sp.]